VIDAHGAGCDVPLVRRENPTVMLEAGERLTQTGSWQWQIEQDVFSCSAGWLRIHGCSTAPGSRGEFEPLVHPDDLSAVRAAFQSALAGDRTYDLQHRIVRRNSGEERTVHACAEVQRDANGTPVGMVGAVQDVSEPLCQRQQPGRQLAQTLSAERHRLASIIEGTDVGTWEWHVQSGEARFDERWAGIIGCTLAEISPLSIQTWRRFCHPDDLAQSDALVARHFAGELPLYDLTCRMRHKDGHWIWVRDRGKVMTWSADGKPLQMFGTHLDITREKLAEEALLELSEFNAQIIASAQEGIIVYGPDLRYQVWNPCMEALSGRKAEEVLGRLPHEAFPFLQENGILAAVERALAGETPNVLEFHFHDPQTGRSGWISDRTVPLRNSQGTIIGAIATVRDITTSRNSEEALRQMNASLEARVEERTRQLATATRTAEAANRAKSAFLANMSHEIRTPMTAILGMAELMKVEGVTVTQAKRLKRMHEAAQHLLSLIDNVLDLAKIEAGKLVLEEVDIDLQRIVASVLDMTADRARSKGLQLAADCPPLPGRLLGDATRIRQALLNYVGNAIKFTERGSISVGVHLQEDGSESVLVRLEVRDTGIGVPSAATGRLFEAFEQADNSMTRPYGGTGLGLTIVRQIARMMGGDAGVAANEGTGSTFWFTARLKKVNIRKANPPVAPGLKADATHQRRRQTRRILIVDDEPTNREVLVAILETAGLLVDCAANGDDAVELAGRTNYDLILMDLQMPGMDGFEATRRLRQLPGNAGAPVLALSGNVLSEVRERCRKAGMNDFIAKPFSMDALLEVVTRWLRSSSAG
jgi:two-component system sensor histidine kinase/response regulator